jgi:hypothetical protein
MRFREQNMRLETSGPGSSARLGVSDASFTQRAQPHLLALISNER